jgi:hypothetical protein
MWMTSRHCEISHRGAVISCSPPARNVADGVPFGAAGGSRCGTAPAE